MYLCRALVWGEARHEMCAVVPGDAVMCARPQGRGYTRFRDRAAHPWGAAGDAQLAHEFHYARIDALAPGAVFARDILRGHGVDGQHDGIVIGNLLAGFCHLRNTARLPWVRRFLGFVAAVKAGRATG